MHRHAGPCTEGTAFTKAQAQAKLTELGYRYNSALYVWELPNGDGGRLEWAPDFCNPDAFDSGTAFQLRHANGTVTPIAVDPQPEMTNADVAALPLGSTLHYTNWPGRRSVPVTLLDSRGLVRFADGREFYAFSDELSRAPRTGLGE